jgi:L-aspartate oxidase
MSGFVSLSADKLADRVVNTDIVVIGTGIAGLAATFTLQPRRVTLLTKGAFLRSGSSPWAQGGVAAAFGKDDTARLHALDTLAAGAGLCDPGAVRVLTEEGADSVRQLIALGARFDQSAPGELALGQEAAHRRRRILHAQGDATGAEMVRALTEQVEDLPNVQVVENALALDLVLDRGRVVGVLAEAKGEVVWFRSTAVVLATGGLGQLFAHTTNPPENTGDGLAMAARAGAHLVDLEFVQFHPTALLAGEDPLPLVSEAVRGEGAILIDEKGRRFMPALHPQAELAPRDVVARAIFFEQQAGRQVFLDARAALGERFAERFPTIFEICRRHGLDPAKDPIPVTPAAHYFMGGVAVDAKGRTSLDGLWACGEVSSTGVHGANRLASNSLLEALVFGARVARDILAWQPGPESGAPRPIVRREKISRAVDSSARRPKKLDDSAIAALLLELRRLAWDRVGLVRDRAGLESFLVELDRLETAVPNAANAQILRNLLTVGRLVAAAALRREESRGGHYRRDFPEQDIVWQRRLFTTYKGSGDEVLQPVLGQDESQLLAIA